MNDQDQEIERAVRNTWIAWGIVAALLAIALVLWTDIVVGLLLMLAAATFLIVFWRPILLLITLSWLIN